MMTAVRAPRSGTDEAKRRPGGVKAESRNQSRPFRHKSAERIQKQKRRDDEPSERGLVR